MKENDKNDIIITSNNSNNEKRVLIKKDKISIKDEDDESTSRKIIITNPQPLTINSPERDEIETAKNNINNYETFSIGKDSSIKNKAVLNIEVCTDKNSYMKTPKGSEKVMISNAENIDNDNKSGRGSKVKSNHSINPLYNFIAETRNRFSKSNDIIENREAETSFSLCFICDKFMQKNQTFQTSTCNHVFCRKCGKLYYEDKIEQGETEFKCPIFKCHSTLSHNIIQSLVSTQHYEILLDEEKNDTKFKKVIKRNLNQKLELQSKIDQVKLYIKPHVIDINTNETFYMFNKAKIQFCPKCGECALFSKSGNHFIKCLNCFHTICKYCLKNYDVLHMDIGTVDHCKVYYRKNEKDDRNLEIWKLFLIQLFLVIASFIMIFIGDFKYINSGIKKILCCRDKKSTIKSIFVYSFNIIIFILTMPIILVFFPYFPVFIEAVG